METMSFNNRISQTLHDEHRATIALMERLETLIGRYRRGNRPDNAEPGVVPLLRDLSAGVEAEIERHFNFEEQQLFTYLDALGDKDIGEHLTLEHSAIRPIGARVAAIAREAAAQSFNDATWEEFRRLGQELCERLLAHVQKEEMALLPVLDEAMDPDTEARLYQEYVDSI